jgi:hypothetical protein
MTCEDKFGNTMFVGDYIIYSVAAGRSAILKTGIVVGFSKKKVLVIGHSGQWYSSALSKPSFLNYPERMLRLFEHQVPEAIRSKLDKAKKEYDDAH